MDDSRRLLGTQASRLWGLGSICWEMTYDGCRWLGTKARRLWHLGGTCWGPGEEGVGHHVVYTRDLDDVAGVLSNVAELPLLT